MSKLKPIVAAVVLGLVGAPAMAAVVTSTSTTVDTQTQLDVMKAKIGKIENILNQNQGGNGLTAAETQDWFNNVTVSGLINVDALVSNRTPSLGNRYVGDSSNEVSLSNASLFVDANINNWTKAHLGFNHRDNSDDSLVLRDTTLPNFDEGYITIADFSQSPFYARLGKQYVSFGSYDLYATVPSLTQLLSTTNQTAAVVGFGDASTFNANVYAFRGLNKVSDTRKRVQNYGASVGFGDVDVTGYSLGVDFLSSMADVNYLASNVGSTFEKRIPAWAANASVKSGPFDGSVKYVTAARTFDAAELSYVDDGVTKAAKPWAAGVDAGYSFATLAHASRIGLGYQQTHEAVNVGGTKGLPEKRYQVGYDVNISKNTKLGFTVVRDQDYNVAHGGDDKANTTGIVRLGVNIV